MTTIRPRIAILGSCITRDLWPIRGDAAEGLLYISRTSLPSLLSTPVAGFQPRATPTGGLHRAQHNALVADIEKTALRRLLDFRPSHLILDFIDERFDLLRIGDSIITHSAELEMSRYRELPALQEARPVPRLSEACDRLWLRALAEFSDLVRFTAIGDAKMILHGARWARRARRESGRPAPLRDVAIMAGRPADIEAHNAQLETYESALCGALPAVEVVRAPRFEIADPRHQWGLSPFHYVPEYYREIRGQLEALGLAGAFSAPVAAPGVPAA